MAAVAPFGVCSLRTAPPRTADAPAQATLVVLHSAVRLYLDASQRFVQTFDGRAVEFADHGALYETIPSAPLT